MNAPLSAVELEAALGALPAAWRVEAGALQRGYSFADFASAMRFMHHAAPAIDRLGHHPEWSNVYNRVRVRLITHDAGNTITALDVALAKVLDESAAVCGASAD